MTLPPFKDVVNIVATDYESSQVNQIEQDTCSYALLNSLCDLEIRPETKKEHVLETNVYYRIWDPFIDHNYCQIDSDPFSTDVQQESSTGTLQNVLKDHNYCCMITASRLDNYCADNLKQEPMTPAEVTNCSYAQVLVNEIEGTAGKFSEGDGDDNSAINSTIDRESGTEQAENLTPQQNDAAPYLTRVKEETSQNEGSEVHVTNCELAIREEIIFSSGRSIDVSPTRVKQEVIPVDPYIFGDAPEIVLIEDCVTNEVGFEISQSSVRIKIQERDGAAVGRESGADEGRCLTSKQSPDAIISAKEEICKNENADRNGDISMQETMLFGYEGCSQGAPATRVKQESESGSAEDESLPWNEWRDAPQTTRVKEETCGSDVSGEQKVGLDSSLQSHPISSHAVAISDYNLLNIVEEKYSAVERVKQEIVITHTFIGYYEIDKEMQHFSSAKFHTNYSNNSPDTIQNELIRSNYSHQARRVSTCESRVRPCSVQLQRLKSNMEACNERDKKVAFDVENVINPLSNNCLSSIKKCYVKLQKMNSQYSLNSAMDPTSNDPELDSKQFFVCNDCEYTFTTKNYLIWHLRAHTGKQFQCEECSHSFTNKFNFEEHRKLHSGQKSFQCTQCNHLFAFERTLNSHEKIHSDIESFSCADCGRSFTHKKYLIMHLRLHTREKSLKCHQCNELFSCENDLSSHQNVHQKIKLPISAQSLDGICVIPTQINEVALRCDQCSSGFCKKSHLITHVKCHIKAFKCQQCGAQFDFQVDFSAHLAVHVKCSAKIGKRFQCHTCHRTYKRKSSLITHLRVHSGVYRFKCGECQKGFPSNYKLLLHERTHSNERPFKCDKCQKGFHSKYHLLCHEVTHSNERPYKCADCTSAFKRKDYLISHVRLHTEAKPYKCKVCSRAYSNRGTLFQHIRSHSELGLSFKCLKCSRFYSNEDRLQTHACSIRGVKNKNIPCPHCDAKFSKNHMLQRHLRTHTGEKPFKCDRCGRSYSRKHLLTSHQC